MSDATATATRPRMPRAPVTICTETMPAIHSTANARPRGIPRRSLRQRSPQRAADVTHVVPERRHEERVVAPALSDESDAIVRRRLVVDVLKNRIDVHIASAIEALLLPSPHADRRDHDQQGGYDEHRAASGA